MSAVPIPTTSTFEFLSGLARDLSGGLVELPAFPDVVVRVQQALSRDDVTSEQLARVLGADAALATRVLTLANSALLHGGETPISDLMVAVTRVGFDHVRTAALAYAGTQLRKASSLTHIRADLEACWTESVRVAAFAHVLARRSQRVNCAQAMLTGLLHNIGMVYIIARTAKQAGQATPRVRDFSSYELRGSYPGIGEAVIQNWQLPTAIATAVAGQLETADRHHGKADLQDVLVVALHLANAAAADGAGPATILGLPSVNALGLDAAALVEVAAASDKEIEILSVALG